MADEETKGRLVLIWLGGNLVVERYLGGLVKLSTY